MIPVPSPHSFSCYIHDISMANLVHRQEPVPSTACRALITWLLWRRWPYVWALRPIQRFSAMLGGSTSIDALWNTPLTPPSTLSTLFDLRVWNRKFQWGTSGPGKAFRTGANLCKGVQRCAERRNELAYDQDVQCVLNVSIPWPGAKLCNRCLLGLWPCSWSSDPGDSRLHFFHPILFV